MMTLLKSVGAVLAGLIVGSVVNMAVLQLNLLFFPLPEGVDMADPAQLRAVVRDMPTAAWIGVLVAHLGQAFVGGWLAARLAPSRPMALALIVGTLTLIGGVINAISLAAPAWMWIEMPAYILFAYAAGRIEVRRRQRAGA